MTEFDTRGGRLRMRRSRGAASGLLLVLLGSWGALIPFVGPYFDFAFTPDQAWVWTTARGWLEVLPGAVTALGGLLLLVIGQPPTWNAAGFTMLALWLVVLVVGTVWVRKTASRYNCPQCGARLPRLHAEGSDTSEHRFLCRHCDTLWFTGVRDTDS